MMLPQWLVFLVALWVIAFGVFRIAIAFKRNDDEARLKRKGLFGRSRRAHVLIGTLYLVLGAYLVAMGLGAEFTTARGCTRLVGTK